MSNRFASKKRAIAECDICGFQFKLKELRSLVVRGRDTNTLACTECWSPDHPQNKQGMYPVRDPQAILNSRSDFAGRDSSRNIQWGWNPVGLAYDGGLTPNNLVATGSVGSVTVSIT